MKEAGQRPCLSPPREHTPLLQPSSTPRQSRQLTSSEEDPTVAMSHSHGASATCPERQIPPWEAQSVRQQKAATWWVLQESIRFTDEEPAVLCQQGQAQVPSGGCVTPNQRLPRQIKPAPRAVVRAHLSIQVSCHPSASPVPTPTEISGAPRWPCGHCRPGPWSPHSLRPLPGRELWGRGGSHWVL